VAVVGAAVHSSPVRRPGSHHRVLIDPSEVNQFVLGGDVHTLVTRTAEVDRYCRSSARPRVSGGKRHVRPEQSRQIRTACAAQQGWRGQEDVAHAAAEAEGFRGGLAAQSAASDTISVALARRQSRRPSTA
jgi:hypothetical protein